MLESGQESVLIIAPHADDEVLGCGGLIEKAIRFHNKVKVIVATVGDTKKTYNNKIVTRDIRKQEFHNAMNYLGCTDYGVIYDDKDSLLDTVPKKEIVTRLDAILSDFNPTMVFFPLPSFHQDHQVLHDACMASLRPKPKQQFKLLAMYEYPLIVWNYQAFWQTGELYLDISDTIDKKIEALKKHKSQIFSKQQLISPEKVKKWAEFRGLEIDTAYAEKYYILRSHLL